MDDIIRYIVGREITMHYADGRLVGINGVDHNGREICEVNIAYDSQGNPREAQCCAKATHYSSENESFIRVPSLARHRYDYQNGRLNTIDSEVSVFVGGESKTRVTHRECHYNDTGLLISVDSDGERLRTFEYSSAGLPVCDIDDNECKTEYAYTDDGLLKESRLLCKEEILSWSAYEYAEGRLAREFAINPIDKSISLSSLHFYNNGFEEIPFDGIARHYYNSAGRLLMRLHYPRPENNDGEITIASNRELSERDIKDIDNVELFTYHPARRTARLMIRCHKASFLQQSILYNEDGNIERVLNSNAYWQGLGVQSLSVISNDLSAFLFI
jgi:hypothetical protein